MTGITEVIEININTFVIGMSFNLSNQKNICIYSTKEQNNNQRKDENKRNVITQKIIKTSFITETNVYRSQFNC